MSGNISSAERLFFVLLRNGLWGAAPDREGLGATLPSPDEWEQVLLTAKEQTVIGLIADGAKDCPKGFIPKDISLKMMMQLLAIEKRNALVNEHVARIKRTLCEAGIPFIMVKGQAVALDYLKPNGRMPGDIDLIVRPEDYEAAKRSISGIAVALEVEDLSKLHFGAMAGDQEIEIHGTVHTGLGDRINNVLDSVQAQLFTKEGHRLHDYAGESVCIPSVDFDALYIFVHLLQHFYCGGLGLRQLCDWARVLHTNRDLIDRGLLAQRLKDMRTTNEWEAFVAFLVKYIGLPEEDAPLYSHDSEVRADKIWKFIRMVGNFGKKRKRRDRSKDPYLIRKVESLCINTQDFLNHFGIFPRDSVRFFSQYLFTGVRTVIKRQ